MRGVLLFGQARENQLKLKMSYVVVQLYSRRKPMRAVGQTGLAIEVPAKHAPIRTAPPAEIDSYVGIRLRVKC